MPNLNPRDSDDADILWLCFDWELIVANDLRESLHLTHLAKQTRISDVTTGKSVSSLTKMKGGKTRITKVSLYELCIKEQQCLDVSALQGRNERWVLFHMAPDWWRSTQRDLNQPSAGAPSLPHAETGWWMMFSFLINMSTVACCGSHPHAASCYRKHSESSSESAAEAKFTCFIIIVNKVHSY